MMQVFKSTFLRCLDIIRLQEIENYFFNEQCVCLCVCRFFIFGNSKSNSQIETFSIHRGRYMFKFVNTQD